jgi:DNA-binding response OmpR family regulator
MPEMKRSFLLDGIASERKRAIVVHDDPTAGYRLADRLAIHGYEAIHARQIEDVKAHLPSIRPNVIVVDLHPSGRPDALAHVQSVCPLVPIIAMTQPDGPGFSRTSRRDRQGDLLGAGVFLCKPSHREKQLSPLQ